jgi:hypothetical protein
VKADNTSSDRRVTARPVEQHTLNVNGLRSLGANGPRMEEGNVQDHGGQGQQANQIQLFHGVCPFFEMFRENRALDGRF